MNEKREHPRSGIIRHSRVQQTECSLLVISLHDLGWEEQEARIVDYSVIGLGIETHKPVNAGLIWFKQPVLGHKCGSLVWCKPSGARYRAGIQFASLSMKDEEYFLQQIGRLLPGKPFPDPRQVIPRLAGYL